MSSEFFQTKDKVCIRCKELKPIEKFALRKDTPTPQRKNVCNHCNYSRQTNNDKTNKVNKTEIRIEHTCQYCNKTKPIRKFLSYHNSPIKRNICLRCHFEKYDNPTKRKVTAKKWRQSDIGKKSGVARMKKHKTNSRDKYLNAQRIYKTKSIKELSDSYVVSTFVKNKGLLSASEYKKYPQLIEAQRANLKLKRKLKTL